MNIPHKYTDLMNTIHDEKLDRVKNLKVNLVNEFPLKAETPLETNVWLKVNNVCCVCIDMVGSTEIADDINATNMAKIYELFSGSLIEYFKRFDEEYMDIRGDGGIAFFQDEIGLVRGLVAAISFRTYIIRTLNEYVKNNISYDIDLKSRAGISFGSTLIKRIGGRNTGGSTYNWMTFGGRLVTTASKYCKAADENGLVISEDIYKIINMHSVYIRHLVKSCDHTSNTLLWKKIDVDGESAYQLTSHWCPKCGDEHFQGITRFIQNETLNQH